MLRRLRPEINDSKDFVVFKENDPISIDGKTVGKTELMPGIKQTYAADQPGILSADRHLGLSGEFK